MKYHPAISIFFVALCATLCSEAQCDESCPQKPYRFISFEGGGVKGIVYGGVIRALEEADLFEGIIGFSGSSAGSKAAALLAAGYTGEELQTELMNFDMASLLDDSSTTYNLLGRSVTVSNPLADLQRLMGKFGWFKGEVLEEEIDKLIAKKTGKRHTTFQELWNITGKQLRITGTCVTTGLLAWFDKDLTPDMPVAKAVHASSAIPFFFQPVEYEGKLYVDGGCLKALPHDAFSKDEGTVLALSIRDGGLRGVTINENISSLMEFAFQLADTVAFGPDSHNSLASSTMDNVDVVEIQFGSISVTDFDLSAHQKAFLVVSGYSSLKKRLDKCNDKYSSATKAQWVLDLMSMASDETQRQNLGSDAMGYGGNDWLPSDARMHIEAAKTELDYLIKEMDKCFEIQMRSEKDIITCHFEMIVQTETYFVYHLNQAVKHTLLENSFLVCMVLMLYFFYRVSRSCWSCCVSSIQHQELMHASTTTKLL